MDVSIIYYVELRAQITFRSRPNRSQTDQPHGSRFVHPLLPNKLRQALMGQLIKDYNIMGLSIYLSLDVLQGTPPVST